MISFICKYRLGAELLFGMARMKRDLSNPALSSSVQPTLQILPTSYLSSHTSTNREAANLA